MEEGVVGGVDVEKDLTEAAFCSSVRESKGILIALRNSVGRIGGNDKIR